MDTPRAPIPDHAEWQALLKAEEDHRRSKVMAGLEQARRGEAMDLDEALESIQAYLREKHQK